MKTILIKISGELFSYNRTQNTADPSLQLDQVNSIVEQIKKLVKNHRVGLVIGGGNFFRGANTNEQLALQKSSAHTIGMLATMVNGIMLHDMLDRAGVESRILSACTCPSIAESISNHSIKDAFENNQCILFVGGTGNPFFTTDTNAVLRGLQIGAHEIWKATKVDGVYDSDPQSNKDAKLLPKTSFQEILNKHLAVIDRTAAILAQDHAMTIRVFNMFTPNALHKALENPDFGSTIRKEN